MDHLIFVRKAHIPNLRLLVPFLHETKFVVVVGVKVKRVQLEMKISGKINFSSNIVLFSFIFSKSVSFSSDINSGHKSSSGTYIITFRDLHFDFPELHNFFLDLHYCFIDNIRQMSEKV